MPSLAELLPLWNALSRIADQPGRIVHWQPSDRWDRRAQEVHPVPTAVVCLRGVARQTGPGQKSCDLQAGDCLLIAAGCLHAHGQLRGAGAVVNIGIDDGVCDLELHLAHDAVDLAVPAEPTRQLLMAAMAVGDAAARRQRVVEMLQQILREPQLERPPLSPALRAMRACIRQRALHSLSAEVVVSASGLGRSAAYAAFKAAFGVSPHTAIETRRCRVAASLLERGHPAAVVAERVGYAHWPTFVAAYRRVHGQAPVGQGR